MSQTVVMLSPSNLNIADVASSPESFPGNCNMETEQPIEVACQSCGFNLLVKRKGAGKTVKCPSCSSPVLVPFPAPSPPDPSPPAPIAPPGLTAKPQLPGSPQDESLSWLNDIEDIQPNAATFARGFGQASRPPSAATPFAAAVTSSPTSLDNAYVPTIKTSGGDSAIKLPSVRNYPVLVIYAKILRIIGYLILVLASIFVVVSLIVVLAFSMRNSDSTGAALMTWMSGSFSVGLAAIFTAGILIMNAELIELAMHIQSNTLATAHAARSSNR